MTIRYHVNPTSGSAGKCKAEKGQCPFGGEDEHFTSMAAARKAFEAKNSTFGVEAEADEVDIQDKVDSLENKVVRDENIDYNYIGQSFEYINTWEEEWTPVERENFEKILKLNKLLEKDPFTARDRKRAEALLESLEPAKERHRSSYGWSTNDTSWRARDKSIISLGRYLLIRKLGEGLTHEPVEYEAENDRLMGLREAQEAAVEEFNYNGFRGTEYERKPYSGETEPYLQESIARIIRGDELPEFADNQEDRTLLPLKDRLHFSLHPESPAYNQQLYLATVFPVRELQEEMAKAGVDNVSVSVLKNGRENGNIYSVLEPDGSVRAFTVYEHRNSDSIVINGKENWDGTELPYAGDSKNNFYAEIGHGDNRQAARTLAFFMKEAQAGGLGSDRELDHEAPRLDWANIIGEQIPGYRKWLEDQGHEVKRPGDESEDDILNRLDF